MHHKSAELMRKLLPSVHRPRGSLSLIGRMADRTRPIVRPAHMDRMVTKGYQKGVYERVTKGTGEKTREVRLNTHKTAHEPLLG
jgi:hypothetical protein